MTLLILKRVFCMGVGYQGYMKWSGMLCFDLMTKHYYCIVHRLDNQWLYVNSTIRASLALLLGMSLSLPDGPAGTLRC